MQKKNNKYAYGKTWMVKCSDIKYQPPLFAVWSAEKSLQNIIVSKIQLI